MDHQSRAHALLSASGSDRWMACPPSARLEDNYEEETSEFAEEGTLAHEFADFALRLFNDEITQGRYDEAVAKLKKHRLYSNEMPSQVEKYISYVIEEYNAVLAKHPEAMLIVESKLDYSHIVEEGFGTGDALIVAVGLIKAIDLKYGKGIKKDAPENPQLRLYGSGALREYGEEYKVENIETVIVQPRLDHISVEYLTADELRDWGENVVKPKAALAFAGEGELKAGDHCRFCKHKPKCRALAEHINEMAAMEFRDPTTLSDDELLKVFETNPLLVDWSKSVISYLKKEALKGRKFEGYKLVHGKSNRKFIDVDLLLDTLQGMGHTHEDITNTKIKGIGDIGNLMSKDDFEKYVGPFLVKPEGPPTFVPESDKRPAMGVEQAIKDFTD